MDLDFEWYWLVVSVLVLSMGFWNYYYNAYMADLDDERGDK